MEFWLKGGFLDYQNQSGGSGLAQVEQEIIE